MTDEPRVLPAAGEVPFDSGCAGCLLLLMGVVVIFFGIAAFDADFAAQFADTPARRQVIGALRWGAVDLGALALMLFGLWEALKAVRRLIARRAVWIEGDVVRFHPMLRRQPLPLSALGQVTHQAGETSSVLWIGDGSGRRIKIAMVDHDAAAAFVAAVEQARAERTFG
jgi:hypothetical protein